MTSPLNRLRTPPQTSPPPPPLYLVRPAAELDLSLLRLDDGDPGGTGVAILTPAHAADGPTDVLRLLEDDRGAGGGGGPSLRINRAVFDVAPEPGAHDSEADAEPPPPPEPEPPPEPRYHARTTEAPRREPEPSADPDVSPTPEVTDVSPEPSGAPEGDEADEGDEGAAEPFVTDAPIAEPPGVLKLRVGSRHARIFVGGAFVPSVNGVAELSLAPGTYSLEVQAAGKVTSRGTIRVATGKVTNVAVPLKPKGQWAPLIVGVAMMGIAYGLWKSGLSVYEEEEAPAPPARR